MDIVGFKNTLSDRAPPDSLSMPLAALWYQAQGEWAKAHQLAQQQHDKTGYWIHAYLHRVEGDIANAAYWYRRAHREPSQTPLNQEWEEIATALL